MAKYGQEPLAQNIIDKVKRYLGSEGISNTELARRIGIHRSTLSEILKGNNASRKKKEKICSFVKEVIENKSSQAHIRPVENINSSLPTVSGKDKPLIDGSRFDLLVYSAKVSSDSLASVLKEVVNAGPGDRRELRNMLGNELGKLRILTSALASEMALKQVQTDVGKMDLP